jgi:tryptophan-rich sensory protein
MIQSRHGPLSHFRAYLALLGFVAACLAVGVLGGLVTIPNVAGWYRTIAKPGFTPPDWVFGPVWTTLYLGMAVAAWLVWRVPAKAAGTTARTRALGLFWAQLILNCAWSFLFFGAKLLAVSAVEIVILLGLVGACAIAMGRIQKLAALLFLPYFLWVAYASALTVAIWWLNS